METHLVSTHNLPGASTQIVMYADFVYFPQTLRSGSLNNISHKADRVYLTDLPPWLYWQNNLKHASEVRNEGVPCLQSYSPNLTTHAR